MSAHFDALSQIQDIYRKKMEIETYLHDVPEAVESKREVLKRLSERDKELEEKLRELNAEETFSRMEIVASEKRREELELRISEISVQRDYELLEKEMAHCEERERSLRRDLEVCLKNQRELKEEADRLAKVKAVQEEEIQSEMAAFNAHAEERKNELENLLIQEKKIGEDLDPELLFKFERIVRKKKMGLVPTRGQVCSGCSMRLPMDFVNQVRAGEHVYTCPYCSRFLYYEESQRELPIDITMGGLADLLEEV